MEKGIEASDSIYKRKLDIRSSERLKLMEENSSLKDQLVLKKDNKYLLRLYASWPGNSKIRGKKMAGISFTKNTQIGWE
ncbi:hypothetical protein GLOIN_2v1787829 [Rhizophagus irregularis DAOM 181602=DAOM 197198]|nr:hypothetical protein GLOIN_2v1787829 [Rhizophagus irregularis DAOM 181602=DAOM 197198]